MSMYRVTLSEIQWDRGKGPEYQHARRPDCVVYTVEADDDDEARELALDRATDDHNFCIYSCAHQVAMS